MEEIIRSTWEKKQVITSKVGDADGITSGFPEAVENSEKENIDFKTSEIQFEFKTGTNLPEARGTESDL